MGVKEFVIGVDPGKATGIAVYDLTSNKVIEVHETQNGIKGFKPVFLDLVNAYGVGTSHWDKAHVACENFTLRSSNKFTANLDGVKIIGWMEGEEYGEAFPEPSQHMQLTRLREKKDSYADSPVTRMMKEAGCKIGKGHTRMGLSVAVWFAAMRLKDIPTLELLKPKDS